MNEKLFHEIAEQVEQEFMCSGLTGGLYEDFAKEILVRYLAAQQSVQSDVDYCTCKPYPVEVIRDGVWLCSYCYRPRR